MTKNQIMEERDYNYSVAWMWLRWAGVLPAVIVKEHEKLLDLWYDRGDLEKPPF